MPAHTRHQEPLLLTSLGAAIERGSFLVNDTANLRLADLSALPSPAPGNTMAAAYTLGRYVAHHLTLRRSPQLGSAADFAAARSALVDEYTKLRFRHELIGGAEGGGAEGGGGHHTMLVLSDGSNLPDDFHTELPRIHAFGYDADERALCGTTGDGHNEFLIGRAELPAAFELLFDVRLPDGLNSGMQLRSAMLDGSAAVLHGPQVEIAHQLPGAIWSEAAENRWLMRPAADRLALAVARWSSGGWNQYKVTVVGTSYNVSVNGEFVGHLLYDFNSSVWPPLATAVARNRLGFQVHSPYRPSQVGERVCWRHVMLRPLR